MSFSIWKSLDPHSSPLSLELGWKGQRMSSKALSISQASFMVIWSRPLNLKIWWQSKPKSGDNQSKNQVTIKACLIRTTWQCRSRHRLRVRQRSLLTWRARDRPANWEQSVKINKLVERTPKLREGSTCPRSSLSAWMTMVRPTMEFSPERVKKESVMSTY